VPVVLRRPEQLADLRREEIGVPLLVVQELTEAPLREPEAIPGRNVVVAHTSLPRGIESGLRVFVVVLVELVSERNATEPEAELWLENLLGAVAGHGGLSFIGFGGLRARQQRGGKCAGSCGGKGKKLATAVGSHGHRMALFDFGSDGWASGIEQQALPNASNVMSTRSPPTSVAPGPSWSLMHGELRVPRMRCGTFIPEMADVTSSIGALLSVG
jgi:hypothetical protein